MGWHVVSVPFYLWPKAEDRPKHELQQERRAFLKRLLNRAVQGGQPPFTWRKLKQSAVPTATVVASEGP